MRCASMSLVALCFRGSRGALWWVCRKREKKREIWSGVPITASHCGYKKGYKFTPSRLSGNPVWKVPFLGLTQAKGDINAYPLFVPAGAFCIIGQPVRGTRFNMAPARWLLIAVAVLTALASPCLALRPGGEKGVVLSRDGSVVQEDGTTLEEYEVLHVASSI